MYKPKVNIPINGKIFNNLFLIFVNDFDTFFDYTHLPADLLKSKMSIEGKDFEKFQKIHEQYLRVNAFFTANLSMYGFQRKYPGCDEAAIECEAIEVIRAILGEDDDWTQYFKIRQCVYYSCQADLISESLIEQLRNEDYLFFIGDLHSVTREAAKGYTPTQLLFWAAENDHAAVFEMAAKWLMTLRDYRKQ